MSFILGWEVMALSAFFMFSTDHQNKDCRKSSLVYILSTHVSTLLLFAFFILWRLFTGSFRLDVLPAGSLDQGIANLLFIMALISFGIKAGVMPMHFWLPGAHANAPSHVSAIMSGVLLKAGIYGLVRFISLLPNPPVLWGVIILVLGCINGLLGVVFALAQHDLKRLLAYHSIENIGIILMGFGLSLIGQSIGNHTMVVLGMAGSLLHVWNHAIFKSLLFFGAGSVLHGTGTRQIDKMGGLASFMPWTMLFFIVGAVAISGLPPLNGLISEFLIYIGLVQGSKVSMPIGIGIVMAVPVLAMIGALATACFVKVTGVVFLGNPRTQLENQPHESPVSMVLSMAILAVICFVIGVFPGSVLPILENVIGHDLNIMRDPFYWITRLSLMLVFLAGLIAIIMKFWYRKHRSAVTWDCGYASPDSRMQYTSSSFADSIVRLFSFILKPNTHQKTPGNPFPAKASFEKHVNEIVLDRIISPIFKKITMLFNRFNTFQQGYTQVYILYILLILAILIFSIIPFGNLLSALLVHQ